jgi:hypothetical protein
VRVLIPKLSFIQGILEIFIAQTLNAVGAYDYAPLSKKMELCSIVPSK